MSVSCQFSEPPQNTISVLPSPPSDACASILTWLRRFTNHLLTYLLT